MAMTVALQIASAAVLGRLLRPEDFGVLATAALATRVVQYFSQFGVANAIVQKDVVSSGEMKTALTLTIAIGAVASGVSALISPAVVHVLGQPAAAPVAKAVSLIFLTTGIGAVPLASLRRQLRFKSIAILEVSSYTFGYLVLGTGAAILFHAGVWALVLAILAQTAMQSIGGHLLARQGLKMRFRWSEASPLLRFGSQVSIIGLLEFVGSQIDTIGVARSGHPDQLGQYNRAGVIANPVTLLALAAARVLLPAFARVEGTPRLSAAYQDALLIMGTLSGTTAAVLIGAHSAIVLTVLGPQWTVAATTLPWLVAAAMLQSLNHIPATLCEARGILRPKILIQVAVLIVFASCVYLAAILGAGLVAFAGSWLLAESVRFILYLAAIQRYLTIRLTALLWAYLEILFIAAVTLLVVWSTVELLLSENASLFWQAVIALSAGIVAPLTVLASWSQSRFRRAVRERCLTEALPSFAGIRRLGTFLIG